jgi:hypothetical protein
MMAASYPALRTTPFPSQGLGGGAFRGLDSAASDTQGRQSRPNLVDRGEFRSISAPSARTDRHGTGRTDFGAFAA